MSRNLFTVREFSEKHPCFSQASLRQLIFHASLRYGAHGKLILGNGLNDAGAILRIGRRVLINEEAFFTWVDDLQER